MWRKPRLIGGAKYRKGKHTGTKVHSIKRIRKLGGGYEGKVYEVEVTLKRKRRKRTLRMAEKVYAKPLLKNPYVPHAYDPVRQFELANELIELNRTKKLGIRMQKTLRLRKRFLRRPTLVQTLLPVVPYFKVPMVGLKSFKEDMLWEIDILKQHGYYIDIDGFLPAYNKATGKYQAVLADFGTLHRLKKK